MELSRAMKVRRPLLWHFILTIEYINLTVHLLLSVCTAFMSNTKLIFLNYLQHNLASTMVRPTLKEKPSQWEIAAIINGIIYKKVVQIVAYDNFFSFSAHVCVDN